MNLVECTLYMISTVGTDGLAILSVQNIISCISQNGAVMWSLVSTLLFVWQAWCDVLNQ